jgi:hypothetical protein
MTPISLVYTSETLKVSLRSLPFLFHVTIMDTPPNSHSQVVAYRLRRMASLIGEREVALRGSTQYVCPLCRTSVSELEFKVRAFCALSCCLFSCRIPFWPPVSLLVGRICTHVTETNACLLILCCLGQKIGGHTESSGGGEGGVDSLQMLCHLIHMFAGAVLHCVCGVGGKHAGPVPSGGSEQPDLNHRPRRNAH